MAAVARRRRPGRVGARALRTRSRDGFDALLGRRARRLRRSSSSAGDAAAVPVSQHGNAAAIVGRARAAPSARARSSTHARPSATSGARLAGCVPGRDRRQPDDAGDMYAGAPTSSPGRRAPWWDVEHQIVAAQPFFRYVVHDAVAAAGRADLHRRRSAATGARLLERCATSLVGDLVRRHVLPRLVRRRRRATSCSARSASRRPSPGSAGAGRAARSAISTWAEGAVPTPFGLLRSGSSRPASRSMHRWRSSSTSLTQRRSTWPPAGTPSTAEPRPTGGRRTKVAQPVNEGVAAIAWASGVAART